MSGFEWLFRMRMLVSGPRGVASGRAPRPMRRTGSEVIGMALCPPVEGSLILHHFGEAPARSWKSVAVNRRYRAVVATLHPL